MNWKTSKPIAAILLFLFTLAVAFMATLVPPCAAAPSVKVQLCMVIDGSGTINSTEWTTIVNSVAKGVNETVPHDGSVELTIVQFGASARTEVSPTVIDAANYVDVANRVLAIPKIGGGTAMPRGLYLAWRELRNSAIYQNAAKHVVNLATDGMPNVRNYNATSDLDGDGYVDAYDDVIAVVNDAANQGLDELDMEGIGILNASMLWFRDNVVRPQPGIFAPPFTKAGWVRQVADVDEFASTIGEKLQAVIGGTEEVWTLDALGAFAADIFTVGITSMVSVLASAVTNPETFPSQAVAQKISQAFPEFLKKWFHNFLSSKRKLVISPYARSSFAITKLEAASYAVALSVLTFAFAYVKVTTVADFFVVIPTVLATSIVLEVTRKYGTSVIARAKGVWTEYRLWYFGLTLFVLSSAIFKVPFSWPGRLTHNAPKFTKKTLGLVAVAQVIIPLTLAFVFYSLFISGYMLIGNIGIVMCLTVAFFDSLPIPPMNGKDIYDWNKLLWLFLFIAAFTLYMLVLFIL
jgi:Zn-dependent protease